MPWRLVNEPRSPMGACVDVRNDDALRAKVHGSVYDAGFVLVNPNDRRCADKVDRSCQLADVREVDAAVLGFKPDGVRFQVNQPLEGVGAAVAP
jgi:hypothetical protein